MIQLLNITKPVHRDFSKVNMDFKGPGFRKGLENIFYLVQFA